MTKMRLVTPKSRPKKAVVKYNRKQAIRQFFAKKKYTVRFEMEDDAIDLRTMAENYAHKNGIIPLSDISEALGVLAGPNFYNGSIAEYDPEDPKNLSPRFTYVKWDQLYLMPIFQRDVIWNHLKKIFSHFDPSSVLVPCAIKITIDGVTMFIVWDGHHTLQAMHLRNYKSYPIWYLDIDAVSMDTVKEAGYPETAEGRIRYAIYRAGSNMRNINSKFKRSLSPFDDFMIGYETGDQAFVSMMNIYRKHGVVPKRHNTGAYALSQHKTAEECYNLADAQGVRGRFLDRALAFHVKHWGGPITMEVFRPMAYLYQKADTEGLILDTKFDEEFGKLLIKLYGDSESVQEQVKISYWNNLPNGRGKTLTHDKERVLSGFINLYNQEIGRLLMPAADWLWRVKNG